jgi:hypothetical protein
MALYFHHPDDIFALGRQFAERKGTQVAGRTEVYMYGAVRLNDGGHGFFGGKKFPGGKFPPFNINGIVLIPQMHGYRRRRKKPHYGSRKKMLSRMLHGKIPAPRRVKNKESRPRLKIRAAFNKMEDFASFFLHINKGNTINAAPVAALAAAFGIKYGPVKKHRATGVPVAEFQNIRGKRRFSFRPGIPVVKPPGTHD